MNVTIDAKAVEMMLGDLKAKMPSALAKGLDNAAFDVRKQVQGWMPRFFDRPTPYAINSIKVTRADKKADIITAEVGFKATQDKLSNAPTAIRVNTYGGGRPVKASEAKLIRDGLMDDEHSLIPAKGAELDAYGNVKRGFMNKVLYGGVKMGSASQGFGIALNGRSQRDSKKNQFFIRRARFGNGANLGIYKNMGKGQAPLPVFLFRYVERYKARFPFDKIASAEAARRVPVRIREAVDGIIAKYR